MTLRITAILFSIAFLTYSIAFSQSSEDINSKNSRLDIIKSSGIKSETIWEYHYVPGSDVAYTDSGYKAWYYEFDKLGRMTQYVKYHVFTDLTIREVYRYGKNGTSIDQTARYNSAGDMIEQIDYKYNKLGKLKTEVHTAFFNGIKPGVYFSIAASISDDSLFAHLQDDLEIDPKLESYTITVNISDNDEQNQYIVIGDESDPTSPRFSWSQLSMENQRGLLAFKGPTRKEHTYISKNIANVNYKYDKNGNLTERNVFNTANDMIEKETYQYNGDKKKMNYYKYNENGKLSSMESYTYDASGRLTQTTGMDPSGKTVSRLMYKYGEGGSLPEEKVWLSSSGEVNGSYKYVYDSSNNILEEIKYRGEGEREGRSVFDYDENKNVTGLTKYDINDKKEKYFKYVYETY